MRAERAVTRGGFTLIELLIVAVILGILAGIAMPNLRTAIHRADAAKIVSDMANIRFAVHQFFQDQNGLPAMGQWGVAPQDLTPYLDSPAFTYKDVEYLLWSSEATGSVQFQVRYDEGSPTGTALAQYRREGLSDGGVQWSPVLTKFHLLSAPGASAADADAPTDPERLEEPKSEPPPTTTDDDQPPPDETSTRERKPDKGYKYVCHGGSWQHLPMDTAREHKHHGDRTTGKKKVRGGKC